MSSTLQLFSGIEFKIVNYDNTLWFHAKTVCDYLGFTNSARSINSYCRKWHTKQLHFGRDGRPALYITLAGLIRLTMKSSNPKALDFQDWVTDDVVPGIIERGGYISPDATVEQIAVMKARISELEEKLAATDAIAQEMRDVKSQGAGIGNLISEIISSLKTPNAGMEHQIKANPWIDSECSPMCPSSVFRARFLRNVSELYKSVYFEIPEKYKEVLLVRNKVIKTTTNTYSIPRDIPILRHAFDTTIQWCLESGHCLYETTEEKHKRYPYKR